MTHRPTDRNGLQNTKLFIRFLILFVKLKKKKKRKRKKKKEKKKGFKVANNTNVSAAILWLVVCVSDVVIRSAMWGEIISYVTRQAFSAPHW